MGFNSGFKGLMTIDWKNWMRFLVKAEI